jgi:hypothetical protein
MIAHGGKRSEYGKAVRLEAICSLVLLLFDTI